MSCKYCEGTNIIMKQDIEYVAGIGSIGEGGYIEEGVINFMYDKRGYLRLVNEDYSCLDHGKRIKANYCFNCGRKI